MVAWLVIAVMLTASAFAKAAMDILQHKFNDSIFSDLNDDWWDPTFSWRNKYYARSEYLGERFPGSTTIFVFVTDAWHMFQFIWGNMLWLSFALIALNVRDVSFLGIALIFLVSRIYYGMIFELAYRYTLKRG